MPSRLIRAEILDSERVQTLPIEARWLFVGVLLLADDLGLFEVASYAIARRVGIDHKHMPALLQLLADADLIRFYDVDGKRYGFIPRFRQRLQIKRTKHPLPPEALMTDDSEAMNKIRTLGINPPLDNRGARNSTVVQPSEPEPEPEPEEEKDLVPTVLVGKADAYRVSDCPFQDLLDAYHEGCPSLPRVRIVTGQRQKLARDRWVQVCSDEKWSKQEALEWFSTFFSRIVERSDFLTGRAGGRGRTWKADFQWLMTAGNFAKVVEGRYAKEAA